MNFIEMWKKTQKYKKVMHFCINNICCITFNLLFIYLIIDLLYLGVRAYFNDSKPS